ncbi:hypothetical protein [Amycolatopsis sp. NBC_01480]|uniref:hypothetical protein n=1 Tax=Amycolatopsis sp. NBC_01480 TaxID=2903562 RepID=UPI002E2A92CF|nr:hypothetical protein [Amycolatopsis sp. NBC_01480]
MINVGPFRAGDFLAADDTCWGAATDWLTDTPSCPTGNTPKTGVTTSRGLADLSELQRGRADPGEAERADPDRLPEPLSLLDEPVGTEAAAQSLFTEPESNEVAAVAMTEDRRLFSSTARGYVSPSEIDF